MQTTQLRALKFLSLIIKNYLFSWIYRMNICENSKEMLLPNQGHNHSPHSDSFNLNQDMYHSQTS